MALRIYQKMGQMTIAQKQDGERRKFNINIYTANALAAFVHDHYWTETETGKKHHGQMLYSFFADTAHAKRILKNEGQPFYDEVVSIKLNTFFKESYTLIRLFTQSGYKVNCYYKEVKK